MAFGGEQRLVFVGAVKVHEVLAKAFEQGEGDRRVIDKLAGIGLADDAAHDELGFIAGHESAIGEDGVDFGRVLEFEYGLNRAGVLAGSDQGFFGAFAQHELEGADNDGFAGTGFASDADEAGAEFPNEFVN